MSQGLNNYYFTMNGPLPASTNFLIELNINTSIPIDDPATVRLQAGANYKAGASSASLPVRISSFNGQSGSKGVQLSWTVDAEESVLKYVVERSSNGADFTKIGELPALGKYLYTFTDALPLMNGYYRVASVDIDGKEGRSPILPVKMDASFERAKLYMSSSSNLRIRHEEDCGALIKVLAFDGKIIKSQQAVKGSRETNIYLGGVQPGVYLVVFEKENTNIESHRFMKF
jgi:hypothetical protein